MSFTISSEMALDALSVLSNPERDDVSASLAKAVLTAFIKRSEGFGDAAPAAHVAAAPVAGTTCGTSTIKARMYLNQTVQGEQVISTHRTVKDFVPTDSERACVISVDKRDAHPVLIYNGVRYRSLNALVINGRNADSQKLYVQRNGVWKSLFQLAEEPVQ